MSELLDTLGDSLASQPDSIDERAARHPRSFKCRCGKLVFFDNGVCPSCRAPLGYLPDDNRVAALEPGRRPGTWRAHGRDDLLKFCGNRDSAAACNWMIEADSAESLCVACRLTRRLPDLNDADNLRYWRKLANAMRRLVSQLLAMELPVRSKVHDDPEHGLMFDFLRSPPGGPRVLTGHASGLITINVEEADDAKREQIKQNLHEPYRTLLGHFRHEVGHYYWDRLIWDGKWLEPFRRLFGDERASYAEALKRNYEQGPPADWAESHISSYAATHPWEDWAETWAHYMHIVDSLSTAMGFGVNLNRLGGLGQTFGPDALYAPDDPSAGLFLELLNPWLQLTTILNELARSMGQPDFYPFVMPKPVVAKLQFVQIVVLDARTRPRL